MSYKELFTAVKSAGQEALLLSDDVRNKVLCDVADAIMNNVDNLLGANAKDLARMDKDNPLYDRLMLNTERLEAIASDMRHVATLPSPLGKTLSERTLDNGLNLRRVSVPFGVIGIIYEARPNVSFDVFSLCFKSGNACLLKGGKDADDSNKAIIELIHQVLSNNGINIHVVELLPATHEATEALLSALPEIRSMLKMDAEAGFMGDPAAKNVSEIILSYPGFKAIAVHRLGHFLHNLGVPYIPRMLNEEIHSKTGVDINPGATIGDHFFIDHGTGVVIGETTVIGSYVKIYQGVTLGALSFPKDACGMLLRDIKRHPTIGDHVTIYANASVLGPITVGDHSVVGSNAWVKEDIPPYSRVLPSGTETKIIQRKPR